MFLRGYGNQNYSQVTSSLLTNSGLVPYKKTNTNYKSGKIGEIQGDATRQWSTRSSSYFSNTMNDAIYRIKSDVLYSDIGTWDFFKDNDVMYYLNFDRSRSVYNINYFIKPKHYKYSIGEMSPCGIASLNEEIVDNVPNEEIMVMPMSYVTFGYSNCLAQPIDNEIRPVNVAVRYYIKAK